jgi:hypothetical protein
LIIQPVAQGYTAELYRLLIYVSYVIKSKQCEVLSLFNYFDLKAYRDVEVKSWCYNLKSQNWHSLCLCHTFRIQNGLKQGDALSTLLFNFASEYAIKNAQEATKMGAQGYNWAILPLEDINTEAWFAGMGLGVGLTTLPCKKENC